MTVNNSTFSNNWASFAGGAIYSDPYQSFTPVLNINNSTFIGNSAPRYGGAITNENGTMTIANSTFYNNSVTGVGVGGAIVSITSVTNSTIYNSTFSNNSAVNTGGGIWTIGTLNLYNTILANSTNGDCIKANGTVNGNNNLIESGTCGTTSSITSDPNLAALADNGGAAQTMALQAGSPAIDAGDDTTCAAAPVSNKDQRGVTRPQGSACDIGAFEAYLPEMAVLGNGTTITDGDTSPSTSDDTNFGSIAVGGSPVIHTFTISNSGIVDLTLSGSPAVTLTTDTHFSVTQPASTTLKAGETTTFTVTFDPQSAGSFTDTVNIINNDPDENPYTFVISGTGSALPVNLSVSANSGSETGETEITVTATASANVTGDQLVSLDVSGAGITGGDYSLSNTTITILNGQSSVTFTVQNDTLAEGNETATLSISNPSAGLTLGATTSQNVAITDNDGQYTITADLASVTEGDTGSTPITFTVTRSGAYTTTSGTVSFALGGTAGSGSDYNNVSPAGSVSFATGEVTQTITLDVLGDYVDENVETISATLSSPTLSGGGTATLGTATAQTSINDDDSAGITVDPTSGLVTNESGLTDTFTIVLNTQPTATVTIDLSSSNTDEGTVSPASVSFTALNWNAPQTVTITGVDDSPPASDGNIAYTIVTAAASSSDSNYNNMNPADVAVTNNDNDTPGFTVTPTSGLTTTEAGGQATFTVVLNTQPAAVVTLPVNSGDTGEGTVSPAALEFTTISWNIPQTVTITGVDDDMADGDQAYTVETGDPTSSDGDYNGASANPVDVSVTNQDNDTPGFTISAISGDTSEDGDTATFTVRLNSEPTGNVVVNVVSSNTATGTVSPGQLTFTNLTWSQVQTVTVTGVDDGDNPDGNKSYTIQLTVDGSTAATEYAALDPNDVSVVNRDNDARPIFLPIIFKGFAPGPDLVIDSLTATGSGVEVVIRNAGNAATPDDFWVDVYFNPNPAPTPLNRTWQSIAPYGANWGVTARLDPGQSLTLVTGGAYYTDGNSSFPTGAGVYAYVDSINYATTYGNILESNEGNNVYGPVISTAGSGSPVAPATVSPIPAGLPQR